MDKITPILLIAVIAVASTISLSYYLMGQPNQTQNNPSPTPTPATTPTPSPTETPTQPFSIPKPSVPEFTLKFVDYSYDTEPIYETDPYTGDLVMTDPSHHIDNMSIVVTIKNQFLTPVEFANGNYTSLFYNFRFKGHYEDEWRYFPYAPKYDGISAPYSAVTKASQSDYTIISLNLNLYLSGNIPSDGEVDFQVEALNGYETTTMTPTPWGPAYSYEFNGEKGGWSETQTVMYP